MKKIIVIGPSGSGKSTLARKIAPILNLPLYHLDQLFWQAGWKSISQEAFTEKLQEIIKKEEWIIDGNFNHSLESRIEKADTIIFLDVPRRLYFPRIFKRYFQNYGRVRVDMSPGCVEQLDTEFLKFVWTFSKKVRPSLIEKLKGLKPEQTLIVLRSKKEVNFFIENLPSSKSDKT